MSARQITQLSGISITSGWRFKNNLSNEHFTEKSKVLKLIECDRKKRNDKLIDLIIDIYNLSPLNVEIKEFIEKHLPDAVK